MIPHSRAAISQRLHNLGCGCLLFHDAGSLMITGMTPAGWHEKIKEFVPQAGRAGDILEQQNKLSKIHIRKTPRIDCPRNAVLDPD